jgi:hypothetical protein
VAPVAYRELLRCGRNRWNLDAASDRDALLIYSVSVKSEAYSLFSHNGVSLFNLPQKEIRSAQRAISPRDGTIHLASDDRTQTECSCHATGQSLRGFCA